MPMVKLDDQTLNDFSQLREGNVHKYLISLKEYYLEHLPYQKIELEMRLDQGRIQEVLTLINYIEKGRELVKERQAFKKV